MSAKAFLDVPSEADDPYRDGESWVERQERHAQLGKPMLGDIVRARAGHSPLRSGCESYAYAVVVRVSPFALVSLKKDMLWMCTVERDGFFVVGRATFDLFGECRERITHGLTNRRDKRERAKVRRRLSGVVLPAHLVAYLECGS